MNKDIGLNWTGSTRGLYSWLYDNYLLRRHENYYLNFQVDELPIIEMNIRRVNLSARLHTNETYESYFKRRVAAAVSNYCEQQADECLATTLRLKKVLH